MKIEITEEMIEQAKIEAQRRNPHISHHFNVEHLSGEERDIIGFLGEFACCSLLGINWRSNIRESYSSIDDFDIIYNNKLIDVKTETVPDLYITKIILRTIDNNGLYGRRLINKGQVPLLKKYDIVIFGAFKRGNYNEWFPLGYLETDYILQNYSITKNRPDGGLYPFDALPIKTSDLKNIQDLIIKT